MKIIREALLSILNYCAPGLGKKDMVEQATSFVFHKNRIYTYNGEVAVSVAFAADGLAGAVQGAELQAVLARAEDEELDVEVTDNEFRIKGRRFEAAVARDAEVRLPLDELGKPKEWALLPADFADALAFCAFSARGDMSKPVLACLHINKGMVESCDNYRLTRWTLDRLTVAGKRAGRPAGFLLPADAAQQLTNYAPLVEVALTHSWAHFRNTAGAVFSARTAEGEYPQLDRFIAQTGTPIELPRTLAAALGRAGVFSAQDGLTYVELALEGSWLTISSAGAHGWHKERARVRYKGAPLQFQTQVGHLEAMLKHLHTVEVCADAGVRGVLKFVGEKFVHCCTTIVPAEKVQETTDVEPF